MAGLYRFEPDYAVHPGETLREKLEELNMNPKEFAVRVGKPVKTISNILNGKSSITPEIAVQFEKVLGISASFWMAKQANYSEYIAREKEKQKLEDGIEWAKKFPYKQLAEMGYVKNTRRSKERVEELLNFFNISKPEAWKKIYLEQAVPVFFRISLNHTKDPYSLSILLRIGEIEAGKMKRKPYNRKKLKEILPILKEIMISEDTNFLEKIQQYCLEAGVKVVYTKSLLKVPINGVVRWIDENPIIQITDRYKRYDVFWFSLFHELGHVLLHGRKKNIFLEDIENINIHDEKEEEANKFAENYLLSKEQYNEIITAINLSDKTPNIILKIINEYAKKFRTHKDIIIGRILYYNKELYKFSFLRKELKKIDFK